MPQMMPRIVPETGLGFMWILSENIKKKIETATNMMPSIRYMTSELTLADRRFTIPQMIAVGIRKGSMTAHWIESLYLTEI